MTQPQVQQSAWVNSVLSSGRLMAASEACTLADERREDAKQPALQGMAQHVMAQLSQHVDAMETLTDAEFFTIANAPPAALCNILARLGRVKKTIEMAARK